jgi:hypothetical protein
MAMMARLFPTTDYLDSAWGRKYRARIGRVLVWWRWCSRPGFDDAYIPSLRGRALGGLVRWGRFGGGRQVVLARRLSVRAFTVAR